LNADINALTILIDENAAINAAEDERVEQHDKYLATDKDMQAGIKAIKGACCPKSSRFGADLRGSNQGGRG